MDLDWIRSQMKQHNVSQADLAAAAGLSASAMSKILGGTRELKASEADKIRRYFGFHLPGDQGADELEAKIFSFLSRLQSDQKHALAVYLEALAGPSDK